MFTRTRITSGLAALAFVGGSMFAFASTANAEVTSPADSEAACTAASGTFSQNETANFCTVASKVTTKVPTVQKGWQAVVEIATTTTYAKETTETSEQIGCLNPSGKQQPGNWQTHQHCQLP